MREIKFRAWDKTTQIMYPAAETRLDLFLYTRDMELMQYTGLKDKNGKEIYEGDIVKVSGYDVSVVWYCVNHYRFECDDFDLAEVEDQEDIEVFGNIYENPELKGVIQ